MKKDVNKVSVLCPKCRYEFKVKGKPDYVYCTACSVTFYRKSNLKKKRCRAIVPERRKCLQYSTIDGYCMAHYYMVRKKVEMEVKKQ